jgi:exosortase/archaeosortase family protein
MSDPAAPRSSWGRWVPAGLLALLAVLLVVENQAIRTVEARCARPLVGLLTPGGGSLAVGDVIFFGLGTRDPVGLRITTGCTTVVLLAPFLLIMAAIAARSPVPVTRVVSAATVGSALLVAVNLIRLTGIAWATSVWGLTHGFEISHFLVGSLVAVAGFAGALVVALRLLVGRAGADGRYQPVGRRGRHRVTASRQPPGRPPR